LNGWTLGFAAYWKEIAVVLAALFAIAGTVFEVKDKESHRVTVWGRIFFGLTILSMIGGFYAQWEENAREVSRNKQSQSDMLKLIESTNRNVYDITRVLQPLGKSNIYLSFKLNCVEAKDFCDTALATAEMERSTDRVASFSIPDVDWTKWPDNRVAELIFLRLFKDHSIAQIYLKESCIECESNTDVSFRTVFDVSELAPLEHNLSAVVMYQVSDNQLFILHHGDSVNPEVNSDKILSTIDLPGATLIARAQNGLFKKLTLISLTIQTDRGQTIKIENPTIVNASNETAFEYVFPDSTQH
jgi:hypothetical protein